MVEVSTINLKYASHFIVEMRLGSKVLYYKEGSGEGTVYTEDAQKAKVFDSVRDANNRTSSIARLMENKKIAVRVNKVYDNGED